MEGSPGDLNNREKRRSELKRKKKKKSICDVNTQKMGKK